MHGLWDIADLGFSHFYFSCKNYQKLAQERRTKVAGFFTTNPKKLSLHFSKLSTIFYAIYKNQQNTCTIWDSLLHRGPWEVFQVHKYALGSHLGPWKDFRPRNWVPGTDGGGGFDGGFGRGSCGESVGAHQCSIWGRGMGRGGSGEWARRHRSAAVVASSFPARSRSACDYPWRGRLEWGVGRVWGASAVGEQAWRRELSPPAAPLTHCGGQGGGGPAVLPCAR
jgi:hypothetical protein